MQNFICMFFVIACVSGCDNSVSPADSGLPKGSQTISISGGRVFNVVPIELDDGTRCVVVAPNAQATSIACDFTNTK